MQRYNDTTITRQISITQNTAQPHPEEAKRLTSDTVRLGIEQRQLGLHHDRLENAQRMARQQLLAERDAAHRVAVVVQRRREHRDAHHLHSESQPSLCKRIEPPSRTTQHKGADSAHTHAHAE
jgi:hypothetical protein